MLMQLTHTILEEINNYKAKLKGVGVDLCAISRVEVLLREYTKDVLSYLFTEAEQLLCQSKEDYATVFAVKEACAKCFGTGFANMPWSEVEVNYGANIMIGLSGEAKRRAKCKGIDRFVVGSEKYSDDLVVAVVIGLGGYGDE